MKSFWIMQIIGKKFLGELRELSELRELGKWESWEN